MVSDGVSTEFRVSLALPSWGPFLTVPRAQTLSKQCHFMGLGVFWVLFRQKAELLIFTYPLKSRACSLLVCLFNKSITEKSKITENLKLEMGLGGENGLKLKNKLLKIFGWLQPVIWSITSLFQTLLFSFHTEVNNLLYQYLYFFSWLYFFKFYKYYIIMSWEI